MPCTRGYIWQPTMEPRIPCFPTRRPDEPIILLIVINSLSRQCSSPATPGNQESSAPLVSTCQLFSSSQEDANIMKFWISAQEACLSSNEVVRFHAQQLLHQIRSHDHLVVLKLATKCSRRLSWWLCANLRLVIPAKLLQDEILDKRGKKSPLSKARYQFLESALKLISEIVVYEACEYTSISMALVKYPQVNLEEI